MAHLLSKSTFMYGCQCAKRLCLHKLKPELRDEMDEQTEAIFQSGTNVGLLARDLFPGGADVSPPDPYSYHLSVSKTQKLIEQGATVIYEAAFQHDGLLCALDILVKKSGRWYGFEVKSSTSIKEQFVMDIAYQYFVITSSGLKLQDISIIHINNDYVRQGELEIKKLFKENSLMQDVQELQTNIAKKSQELKSLLKKKIIPIVDIGPHCSDPYACDFTGHCWSHIPSDSVFDLKGRTNGKTFELYKRGIVRLSDIPGTEPMPSSAAFQLEHFRNGKEFIDKQSLREFFNSLIFPLHFLDFETYMTAVPEFNQTKPWQQIPFQYSLHVQQKKNGGPTALGFLADGGGDPREEFIQSLIREIGKSGIIITWNASFEKSRLNDIARDFPVYSKAIEEINGRVVDLMQPFRSRHYYHPGFKGSYSIKEVLPVMVPELSYEGLAIGDGGMASTAFLELRETKDAKRKTEIRKGLLEYCALDTLAMVRILDALRRKF